MRNRYVGRTGLLVSEIGLGCGNFGWLSDEAQSRDTINCALDMGITLFDTSDYYGEGRSEEFLGRALGAERANVTIATKFGMPRDNAGFQIPESGNASRGAIKKAVEASLKRLRTDYIDLYQVHWPDLFTPIEETLRTLDDLVREGKVRYIGCSNSPVWRVVDAVWTSRSLGLERFASSQDEYSLLVRNAEEERLPALEAMGLGLLPYFPLANGLLSGKYKRNQDYEKDTRLFLLPAMAERAVSGRNWLVLEALEKLCAEKQCTMLELAFSWLLTRPTVASVIAGASRAEQIKVNVASAQLVLGSDILEEINRITTASGD